MTAGVTWVAIAGFVLAVISLGWQIYTAVKRAPRVRIGLRREHYQERQFLEWDDLEEGVLVDRIRFRLTVQNKGAEPVSIYDVGLVHSEIRVAVSSLSNNWIRGFGRGPSKQLNDVWSGEALPVEVAGRGVREWVIEDPATQKLDNGMEFQAYVEQYRAGRHPKEIRSKERHSRLA